MELRVPSECSSPTLVKMAVMTPRTMKLPTSQEVRYKTSKKLIYKTRDESNLALLSFDNPRMKSTCQLWVHASTLSNEASMGDAATTTPK